MNVRTQFLKCGGLIAAVLLLAATAVPADAAPRQYYSKYWTKSGGYYYKHYRYQPAEGGNHRYHYMIYYSSRPRYYYYYNPYTKKYWGRYDLVACGYSKLAPADQAEKIGDIDEKAFPKPGPMPDMPESNDGTKMQMPPEEDLAPPGPVDEEPQPSVDKMKEKFPRPKEKETPREYFSGWCVHGGYYYCNYYCQPAPGGVYSVHRCIYYPAQPRYVYYYNPGRGVYWGRYDTEAKGYSLLADKDKKGKIADIAEGAFPKPGAMPPIPTAKDGTKMSVPPSPSGLPPIGD